MVREQELLHGLDVTILSCLGFAARAASQRGPGGSGNRFLGRSIGDFRYLRECRITCIDTFSGSVEHPLVPKWANALPFIEGRFDSNLAEFSGRVEKIKSTSSRGLARLLVEDRRFDLVYIDGGHH